MERIAVKVWAPPTDVLCSNAKRQTNTSRRCLISHTTVSVRLQWAAASLNTTGLLYRNQKKSLEKYMRKRGHTNVDCITHHSPSIRLHQISLVLFCLVPAGSSKWNTFYTVLFTSLHLLTVGAVTSYLIILNTKSTNLFWCDIVDEAAVSAWRV